MLIDLRRFSLLAFKYRECCSNRLKRKFMRGVLRFYEELFLVIFLIFWTTRPETTNSYLWRIEGNPPSYLFGTIHIDYDLVFDSVPNNVKQALEVQYRVTQNVGQNLALTSKQKFRFGLACPG